MDTQIRLQIDAPKSFADGISFGTVGPYERLSGRVVFAIDPYDSMNQAIVDLERAPCNSSGLVEYSCDLYILRPVEPARGNRRFIYDVNNRGNKRILQFLNDAVHSNAPSAVEHSGNGFLMRRGYSIVWCGWQGDILPGDGRLTMELPLATTEDGGEITGVVRTELIVDEPGTLSIPLGGNNYTMSYETVSAHADAATFTHREYERDPRIAIPPSRWQFARLYEKGSPVPSATHCYLPGGFKPGWIYELIYTAKNPPVMGLGFTAVRDLVSFLLHGETDAEGTPNPLKHNGATIEKAYAWGRSQSGRFLREFVYRGFNEDIQGRRVFDAIFPHVSGGGRVVLNYRFAQPGRYPRQHADHLYPSDQFPFAYPFTADPLSGKADGILKRPDTDPLVIHTQTSSEYWERRGSLVHTDSLGNDLADHEKSRVYLFSCAQHNADPLGEPQTGGHRHLPNPLNTTPLLRALMDAMEAWATSGTQPPDSCVPSRASETAVPADVVKARFPAVSRVVCPAEPSLLHVQSHGPDFDRGFISREPPEEDERKKYPVLVPQVDADGNEVSGIRTPHVEVPLATFTGWNFRPNGGAEKALAGLVGSFLPFARTADERKAAKDPRPSLEERYHSDAHYVRGIAVAAQKLVEQRLLLEEDADRYVAQAMKERVTEADGHATK